MTGFPKPSRTARKVAEAKVKRDRKTTERDNKQEAKRRDGHRCRFPLCGCKALRLPVESSHDRHKGMGGDSGARSLPSGLITLCRHRHMDGIFSRHAGTLRARYLTEDGDNGPVAWDLDGYELLRHGFAADLSMKRDDESWIEVARERAVQRLEPLKPWQQAVLERLAEMEE